MIYYENMYSHPIHFGKQIYYNLVLFYYFELMLLLLNSLQLSSCNLINYIEFFIFNLFSIFSFIVLLIVITNKVLIITFCRQIDLDLSKFYSCFGHFKYYIFLLFKLPLFFMHILFTIYCMRNLHLQSIHLKNFSLQPHHYQNSQKNMILSLNCLSLRPLHLLRLYFFIFIDKEDTQNFNQDFL